MEGNISLTFSFLSTVPKHSIPQKPFTRDNGNYDARLNKYFKFPVYIYYPSQNILLAYIIHCNVFHYAFSGRCIMYFDHILFLFTLAPCKILLTSSTFQLAPFLHFHLLFLLGNPVNFTDFVYKRMAPLLKNLFFFYQELLFSYKSTLCGTIADSGKSAEFIVEYANFTLTMSFSL